MPYAINGTEFTNINAQWESTVGGDALDGTFSVGRYRRHVWSADAMDMSEFEILRPLEGQTVTITTTDYTDRNTLVTYYGAEFKRLAMSHEAIVPTGIQCEFLIRL